jgi:hypothetical protein|tara:strand:- start:2460 stop:3833 length:1374 start_codon:yes stop_codon:yes gene_type:complete
MTTEIISWKGKTFNEISSSYKKNNGDNGADNIVHQGIFRANPLKIYRRERGSTTCNERISTRISVLNAPGGTTVNSNSTNCVGNKTIVDFNLTENKSERPGNSEVCFSAAEHAKRRCRSNGIIKKNYEVNRNNDQYYTNTNQYLESRQRTFDQNQYYLIKKGDKTVQPGANSSIFNVYASNGLSYCPRYEFLTDTEFKYIWIDNTENTVTIPKGGYLVGDIKKILNNTLLANKHYYIERETKNKQILIDLEFDMNTDKYTFVLRRGGRTSYNETGAGSEWEIERDENEATVWTNPVQDVLPAIKLENSDIATALGYNVGTLAPSDILESNGDINTALNQTYALTNERFNAISSSKPLILPTYKPVYYKPSNFNYNTQGAVDSSARMARLKYNAITDNASKYMNAFGSQVANALAYGVPEGGYTDKDKKGFPLKCTPKFNKFYTNGVRNCSSTSITTL